MMLTFLGRGARFSHGATSNPDSRVSTWYCHHPYLMSEMGQEVVGLIPVVTRKSLFIIIKRISTRVMQKLIEYACERAVPTKATSAQTSSMYVCKMVHIRSSTHVCVSELPYINYNFLTFNSPMSIAGFTNFHRKIT